MLLLCIIYVISVLYLLCFRACLFIDALWSPDLLALVCDILLRSCHFPIGILGQVWCLIVSIPDLCPRSYFEPVPKSLLTFMPYYLLIKLIKVVYKTLEQISFE